MIRRLFALLLLWIPGHAGADDCDPACRLERARACLAKGEAFMADVQHERIHSSGKAAPPMRGTLLIASGGRFRLTYTEPAGSAVVSDGRTVRAIASRSTSVFVEAVSRNPLAAALCALFSPEQAPADALQGREVGRSGPWTVVEFTPSSPTALARRIAVTLGDTCPLVRRIVVEDGAGNFIRLTFTHPRTVPLPADAFSLSTPPDATVVSP
jgi:outer membrane lipoprotein-sorting protein